MDGTFKKVPSAFYQLYTIHGYIGGHFRPMLFALMTKKTQEMYERLLSMITSVAPKWVPQSVAVDFEIAMINALKKTFNGLLIKIFKISF